MKKFKGFTLIELIVVIAIIGVLCAILVPSMMGWVTKSRVNSANSNAKSIYNSAASVITSFETQGLGVDGETGTIPEEATISSADVAADGKNLATKVSEMEDTSSKSASWAFQITDGYVSAAVYSSNGKNYYGAFPNSVPEEEKVSADDPTAIVANAAKDKDATVWTSGE